jgi:hypothetical protein
MAEPTTTADTTVASAPTDPTAPAATTQPTTGSEAEINSGGEEALVPSHRVREETEARRKAEERATQLETELETERQKARTPAPNDDEPDPEVEKLLDSYAKRKGLVSQEVLAAEQSKIQVQRDVEDLTTNPPNPGIPYDNKAVMDYAKANSMPITSKAALRAAYREMNYDKIVEAQRQSAIDAYKKAGSSGAEQPGSAGAVAPEEPKLTGTTPKERAKERIRLARQKLL